MWKWNVWTWDTVKKNMEHASTRTCVTWPRSEIYMLSLSRMSSCTNLKPISTPFGTFSVQNKKVMFFMNAQPYIQIKKIHAIKHQLCHFWHFLPFFGTLNWRKPKNKIVSGMKYFYLILSWFQKRWLQI